MKINVWTALTGGEQHSAEESALLHQHLFHLLLVLSFCVLYSWIEPEMQTIADHAAGSDNITHNVALITYIIKLSGLEHLVSQGSSPINLSLFY